MRLRDPQVGEQERDRLSRSSPALVGMDRELVRPIPWRAQVSWMNRSASFALSRWATIQPTTYRLKTSSMTYR